MTAGIPDIWIVWAVAIGAVAVVAILGGLLTEVGDWYESLNFPTWRPPNWLFAPAWTIIFLFIAASGVTAWQSAADPQTRRILLLLFAINAVLNVAWSGIFFRLRRPDWALAELVVFWLSIVALLIFISGLSRTATLLMTPYLLWVTFAGFLNLRMVQLNYPFAGRRQRTT